MPGFIKKIFIFLVLDFGGPLTTKGVSMNNQTYMVRLLLVDLNLDELHYYLFLS